MQTSKPNPQTGLTLIEVLLALGLLATVLGLALVPLTKYYQITTQNQNTTSAVDSGQTVMEQITAHLNLNPGNYSAADFSGIPLAGFTLTCTPLDLTLTAIPNKTCSNQNTPLKRIVLRKTSGSLELVRYQVDIAQPSPSTGSNGE